MDWGGGPGNVKTDESSDAPDTRRLSLRKGNLHDNVAAELINRSSKKESTHWNYRISSE